MHREETVSDLVEGNNLDEMRQKKEEKNKKKQAKPGECGEPGEKQGNVAMLDAKEVAATVPAGESHAEG